MHGCYREYVSAAPRGEYVRYVHVPAAYARQELPSEPKLVASPESVFSCMLRSASFRISEYTIVIKGAWQLSGVVMRTSPSRLSMTIDFRLHLRIMLPHQE